MAKTTNIFEQKQEINSLLDKMAAKNATFKNINNILMKISKFERKVLNDILLKRLKGNMDEFYISTYVIKELSINEIAPEIVQLIFEKDFDDERKAVLVAILDEIGVDISSIDIASAFGDIEKVGKIAIENFLKDWEADFINLSKSIEWLYDVPEDIRFSIIDDVCTMNDPKSSDFLKSLLTSDDKFIVKRILESLSKSNKPEALSTIKASVDFIENEENKSMAERLLRKFSFKGISEEKKLPVKEKKSTFYKIYATSIDGAGSNSVWVSRISGNKIDCIFLLLNEKKGIKDCFGNSLTKNQFDKMINQYFDDGLNIYEISIEKAMKLIRHAIFINKTNNVLISPSFHFLKGKIIGENNIPPEEYIPDLKGFNIKKIEKDINLINQTAFIPDEIPECESWFIMNNYIYDMAEKNNKKGKKIKKPDEQQIKDIIKKILVNEVDTFEKRLYLSADILHSSGMSDSETKAKIHVLLCAALNIKKDPENNPFLQSIAHYSLFHAQMALLNGFDYRKNPESN